MLGKPHYCLDLTQNLCPMTFIKTKLMLEQMQPPQTCEICSRGEEPLTSLPKSLMELGHSHKVVELGPVSNKIA